MLVRPTVKRQGLYAIVIKVPYIKVEDSTKLIWHRPPVSMPTSPKELNARPPKQIRIEPRLRINSPTLASVGRHTSPPLRIKKRVKAREEDPPLRQDRRRTWRFGTAQPYTSETTSYNRLSHFENPVTDLNNRLSLTIIDYSWQLKLNLRYSEQLAI
ncbi:hypothetical protein LR48_Vigan03g087200 [Vigna angularis]|uniref:Uncharacterized protein n=1 Tax=Phaseolus angularis TaxID=3914 RepID=A0A0L9U3Y6_PHAAN|nr:hypothetical protein LR48_Vigan03g087200 [Vigna angularis]